MEVAKLLFMLYLEVCATVCTVELITLGMGKVDKYITKRKKAKEESNKPVEFKGSKELEELKQKVQKSIDEREERELEKFKMMIEKDSEEFRESARTFIENSNKFIAECKILLDENDKHIASLMKQKGVEE